MIASKPQLGGLNFGIKRGSQIFSFAGGETSHNESSSQISTISRTSQFKPTPSQWRVSNAHQWKSMIRSKRRKGITIVDPLAIKNILEKIKEEEVEEEEEKERRKSKQFNIASRKTSLASSGVKHSKSQIMDKPDPKSMKSSVISEEEEKREEDP